jgi:serine protease Do
MGVIAGLAYPSTAAHADSSATAQPSAPTEQMAVLHEMQDAFQKIAVTVEPTVVNIKVERVRQPDPSDNEIPEDQQPVDPKNKGGKGLSPDIPMLPRAPRRSEATGSGVIVRPDGYILTNDHVVKGAEGGVVSVTLADGREYKGTVYSDFRSDLAVVKIDPGKQPLPAATFADSAVVRPGQWAIAVGSPFDLENTMTVGVISAIGRHQQIPGESPSDSRYYPELIQTDAAINPGNSGGPLFNVDGEVVGINVAIESPVEGSAGIGFAIPSDIAQEVMQKLIKFGKVTRGYLGVAPKDLTPALEQEFLQQNGAFVQDVKKDSPAWNAGLRAADIITYFDKKPVTGEVSLRDYIADTDPGKQIRVEYVRNGVPAATNVTIASIPSTDQTPTIAKPVKPAALTKPTLGLDIRDITAKDRQQQGFGPEVEGAYVVGVDTGSPAEEASEVNMIPLTNTVVQKIGNHVIRNKTDVDTAVKSLEGQSEATVVFLMNADGEIHQTAITLHF